MDTALKGGGTFGDFGRDQGEDASHRLVCKDREEVEKKIDEALRMLSEYVDSAVVVCTRTSGGTTFSISGTCGNRYACAASMIEWVQDNEGENDCGMEDVDDD